MTAQTSQHFKRLDDIHTDAKCFFEIDLLNLSGSLEYESTEAFA